MDSQGKEETNLSGLLASASLTLGVGHSGGLLSGLGRLSLRKEDQRAVHLMLRLLCTLKENTSQAVLRALTHASSQNHHTMQHILFRGCVRSAELLRSE